MDGEVEELINGINTRIYLPGLQREFVWRPRQIESLFDSLIREYPIGILTIWKTRSGSVDNYTTYRFLKSYVASDHHPPNEIPGRFDSYNEREKENKPEFLIIDGQQRLNSLYIGICGDITEYVGGQGRSSDEIKNWRVSTLCVDLFGHPNHTGRDDIRGDYSFEFRSTGELGGKENTQYENRGGTRSLWVPVSEFWVNDCDASGDAVRPGSFRTDIIDPYMSKAPIPDKVRDKDEIDLNTVAHDVARDLYNNVLTSELDTNSIKKSGNHIPRIFQRLNREGEDPQPYQLFMSQLMSYWPYIDENPINPREKIRQWVQEFKREYSEYEQHIDRKLFARYSAYLINLDLLHSGLKSISKEDMDKLHEKWTFTEPTREITGYDWYKRCLENAFETIISSGMGYKVMNTMPLFCLLGVFYYENPEARVEDNINEVFQFISKALLFEQAGYSSVISYGKCRNWRREIYNWDAPDDGPIKFPGNKLLRSEGLCISKQAVEQAVGRSRYETKSSGGEFRNNSVVAILGLIKESYGNDDISDYAVDHIFPKSKSKEIDDSAGEAVDLNRIGNLQLLPQTANKKKGSQLPGNWLERIDDRASSRVRQVNQYPDIELKKSNAAEFIRKREDNIIDYLNENYVE
jgi:hypothetical protein